ncbi:DapH/DapD/GlmU-related protein [Vibrio cyclitrophicus]|uniref:DapH/DapD/GlmU-related protein n=1 Tax=Vibrio cyclitrophicus TaxID=47951 RepID=UPI000C85F7B4|nr:DapH/DapD/GlmU-related protein [Vibrio cyclitrophicus]PMH57602.1 hypothetical protein BCU65_11650 [Vibrio cyclitrophicus]
MLRKLIRPLYYTLKLSLRYRDPRFMTSCVISRNLPKSTKIPHPVGIVIGKENGVKIGENCTIMQNVTIGIKKIGDVSGPTIGNNVFIGSNAVIVGDIKVEDNVIIGAGTLVNFDVPKNSKVVNPRCRVKMI